MRRYPIYRDKIPRNKRVKWIKREEALRRFLRDTMGIEPRGLMKSLDKLVRGRGLDVIIVENGRVKNPEDLKLALILGYKWIPIVES